MGRVDGFDQLFHRAGRLAVDFGDDVAAELEGRAFDRRFGRAALDSGLVGRAALDDFGDEHTFAYRQVHGLGERRSDRPALDAEVGVFDLAVLLDFVGHFARGVDRDREADADVAVASPAGLDLRVDADHFAGGVDQRPAGVARVDRRVG